MCISLRRAGVMMDDSPADLALQVRFQRLVRPHLGRLASFARRRLDGNAADAEDLVQEACARAWRNFASLRDESQALGWLYQILRSVLIDFLDTRNRRERLAPMVAAQSNIESLPSTKPGALESLIAGASRDALYQALSCIPQEFALAIELHDIEGLRYRDIADNLCIPVGTVMSRIYRGRRLLAAVLRADATMSDVADRAAAVLDCQARESRP